MKSIRLFARIIKASIKINPVMYTVFLLFCIFTTVAVIYIAGKYGGNVMAKENYEELLTTYSVDFGASCNVPFSDIGQAVNKYAVNDNVKTIKLSFCDTRNTENENEVIKPVYEMTAYPLNEAQMVLTYVNKAGFTEFDVSEFVNSDDVVITVTAPLSNEKTDTLIFNNSRYTVLGKVSYGKNEIKEHLTSYKAVQKNNPMMREISIVFKEIADLNALNNITSGLKGSFPSATIIEPIERNFNKESILSLSNLLIYFVLALSLLNLVYNYRYILNQRKYQYKILRLCGCTGKKIATFILSEVLLVCMVQITIGVMLFSFVLKPVILQIEPLLKYNFDNELYFTVSLFTVLLSLAVAVSGIIYNMLKNKRRELS